MKFKALWTNYKIYGIIIGIVLGTIVYNIISIDFSYLEIDSVKTFDFIDSYIFLLISCLRFYILTLIVSLTKIRDKIYAILLGMESFKLSGAVVVFVKSHNIICFSGIIDSLLKIIILYIFLKNDKPLLNKIFAFIVMVLGTLAENFLIFFL